MHIIYRKAHGISPQEGSLDDIRVGDAVTYFKNGDRTARIAQILPRAKAVKTAPLIVSGITVRKGVRLNFDQIDQLHRDGESQDGVGMFTGGSDADTPE